MTNNESAADLVPLGHNDIMPRYFTHDVGGGVVNIMLRGEKTYNTSRRILSDCGMPSGFPEAAAMLITAFDIGPDVLHLVQETGRRMEGGIPQHSLIQRIPAEENSSPIRNEEIRRRTEFTFKHHDERYTIIAIECIPLNAEIQSPEANVVEGGLNYSYVFIHLKPEKDYEYGCRITVTGKERTSDCQES